MVEDLYTHDRVTNSLTLAVVATGGVTTQGPLALVCSNGYSGTVITFSNRPPFLAKSPTAANSFSMRYYYKTDASFDWPGIATPPAAGAIVPYLRPINPPTGQFVGDPASDTCLSLEIVYRPVWPERDPADASKAVGVLPFGATLTKPEFYLSGVRDMLTAQLLYQQSIAADLSNAAPSATLHDATRNKYSDLDAHALAALPAGVAASTYQGRYYFANLQPHLAQRVFFDPNRGAKGSLVLAGQFLEETLGENYLLLNVLRDSDLAAVLALCPAGDNDKSKWNGLVNDLATDVETFYENPAVPGTYIPDGGLTQSVGVGDLVEITSANTAVDSYAISANGPGSGYVVLVEASGTAFTKPSDPVAMHIFRVDASQMYVGEVKVITAANPLSEYVTFQHTADLAGRFTEFEYEWKIAQPVDGLPPVADATMSRYQALALGADMPRRTIGGAGIQALCDNYVVMRYRPKNPDHPLYNQWSEWTAPKLGEGWIKRVLAGINPFNQRLTDLFNNQVNTDVSMLTQAGHRWEGDVALNLATMNNYGLIEIYETVLRRGRMLSIESGYNYGPANDALLLAAGYLSDLYMMVAGEAWADAANPTIGIGTKDRTYGDVATALFSFKGQMASLLEEELALLRGRDDFLLPGVQVAPIYNRLVWNYTRGIDSGEVIYALNYNIQPRPGGTNSSISAQDAAYLFPQGHGDAYGHYLTALKGYYSLLMNSCFDWVPRIEAVNVLGQPVSVDYMDERKFAADAVGVARAGQQVFDLTWRQDYQPVGTVGWDQFGATRSNNQRPYSSQGTNKYVTRYWGMDHWANRTVQGAYFHWIVGNAILPDVDPNPHHEGIQKIDRTSVPELSEIVSVAQAVQTDLDNAEAGLSPLGIPEGGLAFDINPNAVVGADGGTHFEQIYQRATLALNNAVASFDDAKDVTGLMRSEQDSLADFEASMASQELAYRNALIELYGTPYADDIGPGKTWEQGYNGPDLIHYAYVDNPESDFSGNVEMNPDKTYNLSVQQLPDNWVQKLVDYNDSSALRFTWFNGGNTIPFNWGPHGFFDKPATWTGSRQSPGKIQQAISDLIKADESVASALSAAEGANQQVSENIRILQANKTDQAEINANQLGINIAQEILSWAQAANEIAQKVTDCTKTTIEQGTADFAEALPTSLIAGVAAGGDLTSAGRAALEAAGFSIGEAVEVADVVRFAIFKALETVMNTANRWSQYRVAILQAQQADRPNLYTLGSTVSSLGDSFATINARLREHNDALNRYRTHVAQGDRILEERLSFRQRAAAVIQGYRTRDAAFRLFRNEKLERYKTLFDLAARYSLLAANAYDYETGLLGTSTGRDFKKRMINARALGVVRNGEPQFAGSDTGDPGLSSALAEMKADWEVLRGRLGFNNPDAYGTTVSLRTEALRILPTSDSDTNWKDVLQAARKANILADGDVRRHCMQIDDGSGLPVPGIVLTFGTTIANGYNLFGCELAAGDHAFSPSSFATKIFGVGVAFIGYRGMDNPTASTGTGTSPSDPSLWYLDPLALSSTPYVYLIPVGVDSMRTPPLGDASDIRTWTVEDVAIPMPFNIGASDFSTKQLWQGNDSLTEPLFTVRKHQAFRPVSTTDVFSSSLYGDTGSLHRSQFTNNRLVGRSVWNSQWKLVIPGRTLLNDPNAGLDRFIQTVTDVKLHFVTYSYSGN
ncbi:MAG: methyl-accepting chemotaxis protein [Verrucomicrobia bacterium]|nr:methyl-accepting chemotaxis protein [Verrucomicrobiota bacterium]